MSPFYPENKQPSTDLATVESQRNDLASEEFPEGPYGSPAPMHAIGKSSPWRDDQRPPNPFSYENREFHAGMERGYPGDVDAPDEVVEEDYP
ncbi:hypothetical protein [Cohnella phaseoli]|uniref:Uncharacterized protein n=1 Tax=Cohnella phaseoli TaxID=456490 RepID=A0A3D9IXW5_9BACL|nr:hypothetical protein [Cohnella phaseoli]RED66484.1 hypothetical protein DFP98_118107 [Cohnella phaseoli]